MHERLNEQHMFRSAKLTMNIQNSCDSEDLTPSSQFRGIRNETSKKANS